MPGRLKWMTHNLAGWVGPVHWRREEGDGPKTRTAGGVLEKTIHAWHCCQEWHIQLLLYSLYVMPGPDIHRKMAEKLLFQIILVTKCIVSRQNRNFSHFHVIPKSQNKLFIFGQLINDCQCYSRKYIECKIYF